MLENSRKKEKKGKDMKVKSVVKKAAAALALLTILSGADSVAMAASYPDVSSGDWFYDEVNWASDQGIMTGYENGYFGPADKVTRGQFVTIMYRINGEDSTSFVEGVYGDVTDGWFYSIPAVWGHDSGVMSGYDDGNFGPVDNITREQVATILYRYAVSRGYPTDVGDLNEYPDGGSVSGFAKDGVSFALGTGMIRGDGGRINPQKNASRAEIATILQRFYEYVNRGGLADITNIESKYTIEADVKLTGSGTGYHAKILACTPTSAVSFGIQYDQYGEAPYTDRTAFLIENVYSNDSGGQVYSRTGYASLDKTYHLMLTVQNDGRCDVYVNGINVGSVNNPQLADQTVYLRVEGSGRKDGDSVNATFSNIRVKGNGIYDPSKEWGTYAFDTNPGMHSDASGFASNRTIVISGSITGLTKEQDWDSAYGIVSGIIQFVG